MSEQKPNWYTFAWVTWIVAFVVIEVAALFNKKRSDANPGTVSDHLARWFSVKTIPGRIVWLVVAGGFFAWVLAHIATNQAV